MSCVPLCSAEWTAFSWAQTGELSAVANAFLTPFPWWREETISYGELSIIASISLRFIYEEALMA